MTQIYIIIYVLYAPQIERHLKSNEVIKYHNISYSEP